MKNDQEAIVTIEKQRKKAQNVRTLEGKAVGQRRLIYSFTLTCYLSLTNPDPTRLAHGALVLLHGRR
jgi:hypothetical protein